MNRQPFFRSALIALFVTICGTEVSAQATRTWVSGVGDDANPCSRTAPCKTFAGAISKTAAGGEISVLDPGGFGAVTITKAITINGDGTLAGILAAGTNGIIINAGVNDRIILRSLSINGAGTGLNGIRYLAGKEVVVENCTISGFTTRGIDVALSSGGTLLVENTTIDNVPTAVRATSTAGFAFVTLDKLRLQGIAAAVSGAANSVITVVNSTLNTGGTAIAAGASTSLIIAEHNNITGNTVGVNASVSGATIRLADNGIYNNGTGITFVGGAIVESAGDNRIAGNGSTTPPNGVITLD